MPIWKVSPSGACTSAWILDMFRTGSTKPVFFTGDQSHAEGVAVTFDQWGDYEAIKNEAAVDRPVSDITRERLANFDPSKWVTFEEML